MRLHYGFCSSGFDGVGLSGDDLLPLPRPALAAARSRVCPLSLKEIFPEVPTSVRSPCLFPCRVAYGSQGLHQFALYGCPIWHGAEFFGVDLRFCKVNGRVRRHGGWTSNLMASGSLRLSQ